MAFLPLLVLCALCLCQVSSINLPPYPCCMPHQFEGTCGQVANIGSVGEFPTMYSTVFPFSYDYTNKKLNVRYSGLDPNVEVVITHFFEGRTATFYVIWADGTCTSENRKLHMAQPCESDEGLRIADYFWGIPSRSIKQYITYTNTGMSKRLTYYHMIDYGCTWTVSIGLYQDPDNGDFASFTQSFLNVTDGIQHPGIFDPPTNCQPGSHDKIFEKLRFVLVSLFVEE